RVPFRSIDVQAWPDDNYKGRLQEVTQERFNVVLRGRQEALLRHLLETAFVVVVRPCLHVDQAAAEQFVGGSVTLVEEDGANHRFEGIGQDRLQRACTGFVRAFAQQQVVAQTQARGQAGEALG